MNEVPKSTTWLPCGHGVQVSAGQISDGTWVAAYFDDARHEIVLAPANVQQLVRQAWPAKHTDLGGSPAED